MVQACIQVKISSCTMCIRVRIKGTRRRRPIKVLNKVVRKDMLDNGVTKTMAISV